MISLARRFGVPTRLIFNHSENAALRRNRRRPGIVNPGDEITIPEVDPKWVQAGTEQRHRYQCSIARCWLRLRFLKKGNPRANEPYVLDVDGQEYRGSLDDDGKLEVRIPAAAEHAIITLGEGEAQERREFRIGHLDPIDEVRGVQQRLNSLGYGCGIEDGDLGDRTRRALRRFQAANDLTVTGEIDQATRDRLREAYGC